MYIGGALIFSFTILPLIRGSGIYFTILKTFILKSIVAKIQSYTPFYKLNKHL
jgi:hypothetical protein